MIVDGYDAILLDLDGVLFRGDRPIEGAAAAVDGLRAMGLGLAFVTNNSARTPEEVATHLATVGITADPDEIETSALVTASHLASWGIERAGVIGERGLRDALICRGITVIDDGDEVDAVIVGWDRSVDYESLRRACARIGRGARFVASNPDTSYPAPDGTIWPGAGAIAAAISAATGVEPFVIGKPNAPILEAALERAGGGRPLVVGDRLDTDIEGAARLGWGSALVLTGISTRDDIDAHGPQPTFVVDRLDGLLR
jgi:HAD superfamily hydrolase (TIGR01457 family)